MPNVEIVRNTYPDTAALYGVEANSGHIFVPGFIVISVQGISAVPKPMPVQASLGQE